MAWNRRESRNIRFIPDAVLHDMRNGVNRRCFIRKEHECGKMFGASKSCFIGCPSDDELDPLIDLMSEKLMKHGIEPIIAVRDRAYGQDIFCTKICGKIIESRFCAVILDDVVRNGVNIPNPNVYYEYGLMTSLGKHIIPLQKQDEKLAFNIQSYDTIKYNSKNMSTELERAIRDAIQITQIDESVPSKRISDTRGILRKIELAGFSESGSQWFLSSVIEDTLFKGFYNQESILFMAKVDNENDIQICLDDIDIVIYRTERKADEIERGFDFYKSKTDELEQIRKNIQNKSEYLRYSSYEHDEAKKAYKDYENKNYRMKNVYIAFFGNSDLFNSLFCKKISDVCSKNDRYHVCFSNQQQITIGLVSVDLNITNNTNGDM
jgi:hypothetical protein